MVKTVFRHSFQPKGVSCGLISCALLAMTLLTLGCATTPSEDEVGASSSAILAAKQNAELVKKIEVLEGKLAEQGVESLKLQHENQVTQRRLWELSKLMDNHAMRLRSGFSFSDAELEALQKQALKNSLPATAPLPDKGPTAAPSAADDGAKPLASTKTTTDLAERKMKLAEYGEAIALLSELDKTNPGLEDSGRAIYLLARSWLAVGQAQNTLVLLRRLQNRFPSGPHKIPGKFLEAEAQESLGAKQKSQGLYREVLALEPAGELAQKARKALARIREEY